MNRPMTNHSSLERRKALADAISGVAGSLVSLWTFYPIEVLKTNLQAGSSAAIISSKNNNNNSRKKNKSFFQGCKSKTIHTATSNFVYFYFYSWIFSKWKKQRKSNVINPSTRLFLSAVAAMLNTFITLPLDVLSSKQVTTELKLEEGEEEDSLSSSEDEERKMDEVWGHLHELHEAEGDEESYSEFKDSHSDLIQSKMEEYSPRSNGNNSKTLGQFPSFHRLSSYESLDIAAVFQKYYTTDNNKTSNSTTEIFWEKYSGLWKGLVPALLLCSNPSIHYTAFDMAKNRILSSRKNNKSTTSTTTTMATLSMSEAFLVGLFAKFVATITTYPLIRAKVILMVTSEKSMIATLCRSYKEEGVRGLYKGCDWQLIHTVLKSALMMMVREKISNSTQRLIAGETKQR